MKIDILAIIKHFCSFFYDKSIQLFRNNKYILIRYFVKELMLYFLIAFLFFFLVFFVNQILLMAQDILRKHVPVVDVIKLITYSLPFVIAQSAPFGTLVGFLMCIGRLMTDNEILILRATGVSFVSMSIPVIILGIFISILSFFVNDYLLPLGTLEYSKLYRKIIITNPGIEIESNSIKRTSNSILVIGNVKDRDISDLLLFDTDNEGNQRLIISGNTKIQQPSDPTIMLQFNMKNPSVVQFDKDNKGDYSYINAESSIMNLFMNSFSINDNKSTNPREMTSYDLKKYIVNMKKNENITKKSINIYELEYNKKFSLPFGSLFFSLLAFPLGIIFGKNNGQTIGLIVGILLSVIYWTFLTLGQMFGLRNGFNGFIAMWLPNMVVGICGFGLFLLLVKK